MGELVERGAAYMRGVPEAMLAEDERDDFRRAAEFLLRELAQPYWAARGIAPDTLRAFAREHAFSIEED